MAEGLNLFDWISPIGRQREESYGVSISFYRRPIRRVITSEAQGKLPIAESFGVDPQLLPEEARRRLFPEEFK